MFGHNVLHPCIEISLQVRIVLESMSMHELLDLGIRIPLFAIYFIAADMKEPVGKQRGHFSNEFFQKFVSALARRIHRGIEHSPLALDRIRAWRAG